MNTVEPNECNTLMESGEINGNQWLPGTNSVFKAALVNIPLSTKDERTVCNVKGTFTDEHKKKTYQHCSSLQL